MIPANALARIAKVLLLKSSILNIPEQAFVTIIRENNSENIGNGTQLLSEMHK
jgi:4-oxalocrotonate tautomerase